MKLEPNKVYNVQHHAWLNEFVIAGRPATYLEHALARAAERAIRLPLMLEAKAGQVIELRTDHTGKPEMALIRQPYQQDRRKDLIICLDLKWLSIRTVYLNWKSDNHQTLKIGA